MFPRVTDSPAIEWESAGMEICGVFSAKMVVSSCPLSVRRKIDERSQLRSRLVRATSSGNSSTSDMFALSLTSSSIASASCTRSGLTSTLQSIANRLACRSLRQCEPSKTCASTFSKARATCSCTPSSQTMQPARRQERVRAPRRNCAAIIAPRIARRIARRTDEEDDRARRDELREVLADRREAGERADGAELDGARVAARGAQHLREGVALRGEDGDHRHLAQPRERLQRVELQRALRGDVADDRPEQPLVDDPHLVRLGLGDLGEHVHRVLLERLVAREQ